MFYKFSWISMEMVACNCSNQNKYDLIYGLLYFNLKLPVYYTQIAALPTIYI